jgi:hypothetical protein
MKRYHNVVQAEQWNGEPHPLIVSASTISKMTMVHNGPVKDGDMVLQAERCVKINIGDWIVKQSDGTHNVINDVMFRKVYHECNDSNIVAMAFQLAYQDLLDADADAAYAASVIGIKEEDYVGDRDFPKVVAKLAIPYMEAMREHA